MTSHIGKLLRKVNQAIVLDVDGVITSPSSEIVEHPVILEGLISELKAGRPVALITGRGIQWLTDGTKDLDGNQKQAGVLTQLEERVEDKKLLDLLFVSAEFGGETITYEEGVRIEHPTEEVVVPEDILKRAQEITESDAFKDVMIREPKNTQFTSKIQPFDPAHHPEYTRETLYEEYKKRQERIAEKYSALLSFDQQNQFEVHIDRIAVNIRDRKTNKVFAARQYMSWLEEKRITSGVFYVLGDSKSDTEIAEGICQVIQESGQDAAVTFVFVGTEQELKHIEALHPPYTIRHMKGHCDEGTVEFIRQLKDSQSTA
jgi:hypothetical protein